MTRSDPPSITLTVSGVQTLDQIQHWAALADGLMIPGQAAVSASGVDQSVSVTCPLPQTVIPTIEDED